MPRRRAVLIAMSGFMPDLGGRLRSVSRWFGGDAGPLPVEEWRAWCSRFLDSGRVVDTGNRGVSHTEGQGYGLLLAVAADDVAIFDDLWAWTDKNLPLRDDGLRSWRWDPSTPHDPVQDENAALDGDLLIAWAMLKAGDRWQRPELTEQGLLIARAIRTAGVIRHADLAIILPGPEGFTPPEGPVINLSYWIFPALRTLAVKDENQVWGQLIASGQRLAATLRFGQRQLPPDWTQLTEPPRPAPEFPPVFGYNALRIPLYAAWSEPNALDLVAPIFSIWERSGSKPPSVIPLDASAPLDAGGAGHGVSAILAVLRYLKTGAQPAFPSIRSEPDYYAATLVLLARLAFDEVARS